jgi:hypothetical protein
MAEPKTLAEALAAGATLDDLRKRLPDDVAIDDLKPGGRLEELGDMTVDELSAAVARKESP